MLQELAAKPVASSLSHSALDLANGFRDPGYHSDSHVRAKYKLDIHTFLLKLGLLFSEFTLGKLRLGTVM